MGDHNRIFSLQYQYSIKHPSDGNKKYINKGSVNWSNSKFIELSSQESYGRQ